MGVFGMAEILGLDPECLGATHGREMPAGVVQICPAAILPIQDMAGTALASPHFLAAYRTEGLPVAGNRAKEWPAVQRRGRGGVGVTAMVAYREDAVRPSWEPGR